MKDRSILKFFAIYFGFTVVSNFVHSITPAFLQMIAAPSYINGVAFSVMSLCSFFASPFWGKMGDRKPYPALMAVGFFGYALGQLFFSMARGVPMLVFARIISGLLNGALQVNALSYLISVSEEHNRGQYLAMYAMLQSVGTCIGYLIGGVIGDYSLMAVFYVQVGAAVVLGLLTPLVLRDAPGRTLATGKIDFAKINPITSMSVSLRRIDAAMGVYLAVVFCFGFAMMSYDNYFGYFLRDQFGFPTSYNGYFKAVIGVIAILANSTINIWINNHTNVRRSITVVLGLCSVSIAAMLMVSGTIPAFLGVALVYYTCNAITLPILQVMMMKDEDKSETGTISGLFNAFLSLGRTFGPLIAAAAYGVNPLYPFLLAAAFYLIAALLSVYNKRQYEHRPQRAAQQ